MLWVLVCSRSFRFYPLGFLLHWRHFDTSRLCNCNIKIRSFLVINICNQGKTLCSPCMYNVGRTQNLWMLKLVVHIVFKMLISTLTPNSWPIPFSLCIVRLVTGSQRSDGSATRVRRSLGLELVRKSVFALLGVYGRPELEPKASELGLSTKVISEN